MSSARAAAQSSRLAEVSALSAVPPPPGAPAAACGMVRVGARARVRARAGVRAGVRARVGAPVVRLLLLHQAHGARRLDQRACDWVSGQAQGEAQREGEG